ncbi:hypothetical protein N7539_001760 [Penicillium diatomitis]|uniref:Uncharacterized protein n=1 Tax=Penicillium diatomitis TaxID=2819901 RepID=A0A9X0C0I7_9EURO|nr:uncharacterized protein N7539_001760 [Penicillium diatomitis]KAJ5493014.1 hypothetical protein N7539_001760 [Penicillium diatomitis]
MEISAYYSEPDSLDLYNQDLKTIHKWVGRRLVFRSLHIMIDRCPQIRAVPDRRMPGPSPKMIGSQEIDMQQSSQMCTVLDGFELIESCTVQEKIRPQFKSTVGICQDQRQIVARTSIHSGLQ